MVIIINSLIKSSLLRAAETVATEIKKSGQRTGGSWDAEQARSTFERTGTIENPGNVGIRE